MEGQGLLLHIQPLDPHLLFKVTAHWRGREHWEGRRERRVNHLSGNTLLPGAGYNLKNQVEVCMKFTISSLLVRNSDDELLVMSQSSLLISVATTREKVDVGRMMVCWVGERQ